jgi:hypothetical protein
MNCIKILGNNDEFGMMNEFGMMDKNRKQKNIKSTI